MIVALAGHVDHGKTSLIRALTGVETDRLQQEVERGLTIDLGFAYWREGEHSLGFVDVPGHHRFIHNLLAGVSPHQQALLVIAADDGVMPQTREHLAIMQLLGLRQGVIALNKIDRVDSARRSQIEAQIRDCVAGTFLERAPLIAVSATSGEGVARLRSALLDFAEPQKPASLVEDFGARLPIDRAFSNKGVGTIVTGTLHAGQLQLEQTLSLFPGGQQTRVRSLRVNAIEARSALPGTRVALNLAGIEVAQAKRGMWLHSGAAKGQRAIVVALKVLSDFPRAVKHWAPVHIYHGAAHTLGHLALLEPHASADPGETVMAELVCAEPLLAARGDRIIVRDHGLDQTLGGGAVLSVQPAMGRRRAPERLAQIRALAAQPDFTSAFQDSIEQACQHLPSFSSEWGLTDAALTRLCAQDGVLVLDEWAMSETHLQRLVSESKASFDALLDNTSGLTANQFCSAKEAPVQAQILKQLTNDGHISLRSGRYFAPSAPTQLSSSEQQLLDRLLPFLRGKQPPSLGDIGKQLPMPIEKLRRAVVPLAGKGELVLFGNNRVMRPAQLRALAELAFQLSQDAEGFSVKAFRDASGLGRNLVIDLLEHMDAAGFTRRNDNTRKVVGSLASLLKQ